MIAVDDVARQASIDFIEAANAKKRSIILEKNIYNNIEMRGELETEQTMLETSRSATYADWSCVLLLNDRVPIRDYHHGSFL